MNAPVDLPPITFTISHQQRLENLLGSWELRARANAFGTEAGVLRDNIAAVKATIAAARLTVDYREAWKTERDRNEQAALVVDEVRAALDDFARFKGPRPKRVDMAALATRLQAAYAALEY